MSKETSMWELLTQNEKLLTTKGGFFLFAEATLLVAYATVFSQIDEVNSFLLIGFAILLSVFSLIVSCFWAVWGCRHYRNTKKLKNMIEDYRKNTGNPDPALSLHLEWRDEAFSGGNNFFARIIPISFVALWSLILVHNVAYLAWHLSALF